MLNKFYLHNGKILEHICNLADALPLLDDTTFLYHANNEKNDFSNWIEGEFGDKSLAQKIKGKNKIEMSEIIWQHIHTAKENILVLNAGSSSLKFELIEVNSKKAIIRGNVDGIGLASCKIDCELNSKKTQESKIIKNHDEAIDYVLSKVKEIISLDEIYAVGHRVVHGGEFFHASTLIDNDALKKIDELSLLAPLHNPPNVRGIVACKKFLPSKAQVAVFDTAFHSKIPAEAYMYAIPIEYYNKYKIRKYGFHGTSHKYVYGKACEIAGKKLSKVITCHLGNGDSICAIKDGQSIETSMGFTPLQGLIMGTRSGDIDPEIVAFLSEKEKISARDVINLLNKKSGLIGISGYSDMRTLHQKITEPNSEKSKLAFDMYIHRLVDYIGGYIALLNGVDAIIFTAGIGEGAYYMREKVIEQFEYLGIKIDGQKNERHEKIISAEDSKSLVMVVPTNEELEIALQTKLVIDGL